MCVFFFNANLYYKFQLLDQLSPSPPSPTLQANHLAGQLEKPIVICDGQDGLSIPRCAPLLPQ